MNKKMAEAMVAGDINTVSSLYAPDAISQPDYKPKLKGHTNIINDFKKDITSGFKYSAVHFETIDY